MYPVAGHDAAGSVVVRFIEDGSRYWFPVTQVERFLRDMQSNGRDAASDTIGQGSHAFAAQVLAGTLAAKKRAASGMTSSSATAGMQQKHFTFLTLGLAAAFLRRRLVCLVLPSLMCTSPAIDMW